MRSVLFAAVCLLALAGAGCTGFPPGSKAPSQAGTQRSDAPAPRIDACKVMTADDVQSALGITVDKTPVSSPQGSGGSVVGSCIYAAPAQNATAGLVLLSDLPIEAIGVTAGYHAVPGVGDRAYINSSTLIGQKGKTTFQIVVAMSGSQANLEKGLKALGQAVAARL